MFSSENVPTIHMVLPTIDLITGLLTGRTKRDNGEFENKDLHPAVRRALVYAESKMTEYYEKTEDSVMYAGPIGMWSFYLAYPLTD